MKRYVLIAICLLLLSFDNSKLINELKANYRAHLVDFQRNNTDGKLLISCAYLPLELIHGKKEEIEKKNKEIVFQLQLKSPSVSEFLKEESDSMDFTERVVYYASAFKNDIELYVDGVKKPILMYAFERSFNLGAPAKCLISFKLPERSKTLKIIIRDKIYDKSTDAFEFDLKIIREFEKKLEKLK